LKPLIIIAALIVIIIAGSCFTLSALGSESQRLAQSLSELEQDIEKQNWEAASEKLGEFHSKWDKVSSIWSMLVDHYEIDSIELALAQLAAYVKTRDKNEALSRMSSLRTLIKHIPEKEAFSLQNIF